MIEESARELAQELVEALDGTCLHEWMLAKSAAWGGLVVTHPDGRRYAVQLDVWEIEATEQPGGAPPKEIK